MQNCCRGHFLFHLFTPFYYAFLMPFRNHFAEPSPNKSRKSIANTAFSEPAFQRSAVLGIPPCKFCENLHETPCRSAGEKVPEIRSPQPHHFNWLADTILLLAQFLQHFSQHIVTLLKAGNSIHDLLIGCMASGFVQLHS